MVQAQVFCHFFLGIARTVAANDGLFAQFAEVYMKLLFKLIIVLTYQANEAKED